MTIPFGRAEENWSDRPCYVIGGGPSLIDYDLGPVKALGRTVGANKVALVARTDALVSIDVNFPRLMRDDIASYVAAGGRAYLALPAAEDLHRPVEGATYLLRERAPGILWDRTRLNGVHSGYAALALAATLGARDIGVLGVDMNFTGETTHWHGGYPWHRSKNARALQRWAGEFGAAATALHQRGVRVTFFTTELTCPAIAEFFPTRPLRDLA